MPTLLPVVTMIALAGFACAAQAQCPELARLRDEARLRSEAVAVIRPLNRSLKPLVPDDRCDAYIRTSLAWSALRDYAHDHQEACDVSGRSLDEIDRSHHDAMTARNNVCAGRPVRAFPADIILR